MRTPRTEAERRLTARSGRAEVLLQEHPVRAKVPGAPREDGTAARPPRAPATAPDDLRTANENLVLAALRWKSGPASRRRGHLQCPSGHRRPLRPGGRAIYVNASASRMSARSVAQPWKGAPGAWRFGPGRVQREVLTDAFGRGLPAETYFTFDGPTQRTFHVRTIPEPGGGGAIGSVVAIARDVTDSRLHRRAREDADRLSACRRLPRRSPRRRRLGDIARVLAAQAHAALQADAAVVMLLDETGGALEIASAVGYPQNVVDRWGALSLDAEAPLPEAIRRARRLSSLRPTTT